MGKKTMTESSANSHSKKISRNRDKKQLQLNSSLQIKVLKPKVYITDSWNFKSLVQELTGNNGSSHRRRPVQHPVPVMDNLEDHACHDSAAQEASSLDSSSEESALTSFETYNNYSTGPCIQQPDFNMLESWLLETTTTTTADNTCYDHHRHQYDDVYVPMMMSQELEEDVSVYDYDLCFSYEDYSVQF